MPWSVHVWPQNEDVQLENGVRGGGGRPIAWPWGQVNLGLNMRSQLLPAHLLPPLLCPTWSLCLVPSTHCLDLSSTNRGRADKQTWSSEAQASGHFLASSG